MRRVAQSILFLAGFAALSLGCGPDDYSSDLVLEEGEVFEGEVLDEELDEVEQAACTSRSGYTPYPSGVGTFTTTTSAHKWTENFGRYAHNETVECSSSRSRRSSLDTTSGCLYGRHVNGSQLFKRGWTTTHNFRAVALRLDNANRRARYTKTSTSARFHVKAIQRNTSTVKPGVNLFARYTNADNLYVAALKTDGTIFIQSKVKCNYRTIARGKMPFKLGTWYTLKLTVERQADGRDLLRFYVDNMSTPVLTGRSSTNNGTSEANHLRSGTVGVRTDYVDVFLDDWKAF